ncbi:hypothetical protein WA158_006599 [Blastocystis sp. Blastoise]
MNKTKETDSSIDECVHLIKSIDYIYGIDSVNSQNIKETLYKLLEFNMNNKDRNFVRDLDRNEKYCSITADLQYIKQKLDDILVEYDHSLTYENEKMIQEGFWRPFNTISFLQKNANNLRNDRKVDDTSKPRNEESVDYRKNSSKEVQKESESEKRSRRPLRPESKRILYRWLYEHVDYPYPTLNDQLLLSEQTNLSFTQVNNWFINTRKRYLNRKGYKKEFSDFLSNEPFIEDYDHIDNSNNDDEHISINNNNENDYDAYGLN